MVNTVQPRGGKMNSVVFLVLRKMRGPLLLLSAVYAVATFGLTIIPGIDDQGNVWHMDFFHAFYFVTFMGTTIGFGELPYPFTDAQRMWALIFIYITVATWIYAVGALISLLQNETLRKAFTEFQFGRQVKSIREPFYLVCGYGDTGSRLVDSLRHKLIPACVIDIKQDRMDALTLAEHPRHNPGLCANAADPDNLLLAGVTHPQCEGVVALTNDNAVNLHIAISTRVMNPEMQVICRADLHEIEANMASFGTDHIVDPFDTFASLLGLAIHSPHQYLLNQWFHNEVGEPLSDLVKLPTGRWIVCGYGRFGQAIYKEMTSHGLQVQVIEPRSDIARLPQGSIAGMGTEAVTLREADVENAVGIVAGADDDSNNLSIVVTARELNPELFVIIRQTEHFNRELFAASEADLVMGPSEVLVSKIRSLLTNPLVDNFLSLARAHTDDWARDLTGRIRELSPTQLPEVWAVTIEAEEAYAVFNKVSAGDVVKIGHLLTDHVDREQKLPAMALLYSNSNGAFCSPELDTELHIGDQLLFAGTSAGLSRMQWNLQNDVALTYVMTGTTPAQTTVGRWVEARFARRKARRVEAGEAVG
jgi:voltage-gated potassium channel